MVKKRFRYLRTKIKEIIKTPATPNALAVGAAVGIFWNFIPSLGIGPFLSFFTSKLLKGSAVAAVSINLATGFFIPLFYTLNVAVGRSVLGNDIAQQQIEKELGESFYRSISGIETIIETPSDYLLLDRIQSFSSDFIMGSIINASASAVLIYGTFWFILNRRKNHKKSCKL